MRISDWSSDVCSSDLDWQGEVFDPRQIARILDGLAARGALARCDALLTGYIGDPALGAVILDTFSRIRAANPQALWTCDPVMGHKGKGLFVRAGVLGFLAEGALPAAAILTPHPLQPAAPTHLKP